MCGFCNSHLLLLHQLGVGAIIDDIGSKHRSGQGRVDLFGADITQLAVQDELVTLGTQVDSRLFAEENKGENVAILFERAR